MSKVDFERALSDYINALNNGCNAEIEKYKLLCESSNFLELVVNYNALSKAGITFEYGKSSIQKGTKLYRIRKYDSKTDFSNPREWEAPPNRPQGRANLKGQEALYLGSTENICLLETHMKKDEKYVLGVYEIVKDIEVGGYLSFTPIDKLHYYSGIVLNAFLIAPARNERNTELFSYLDSYYRRLSLDNFKNMSELIENGSFELPIKLGVLNQRDEYYKLTNKICNILSKSTPDGIRYSSCYIPLETSGIECSDYNIVLYHEGISKIKFINYEIKTNLRGVTGADIIKSYLEIKET
ncbi:TPA: RES family NAD+ phosphorylase [Clostridium perfringens]|nr:RES family NAD+ phosphorylase [Clostridium perfringens]